MCITMNVCNFLQYIFSELFIFRSLYDLCHDGVVMDGLVYFMIFIVLHLGEFVCMLPPHNVILYFIAMF